MSKCSEKNKVRDASLVAVFNRNRWQFSSGMGGSVAPEYAFENALL